ncbi:PanC Panthothenate synthetase [Candidatus Nanopelagicaceae bacterium]
MKVVHSAQELPSGCAFVPTMGALHAGHGSLFSLARESSDSVIASIFINPLQFENQEDLLRYPKTPESDIELAQSSGVTHLWFPKYDEIYPEGFQTLKAGAIGDLFEGASRPGHFDGVVTVVNRLFQLVKPVSAVFGEKDFQQLRLVEAMAADVKIIRGPIVRESDGLAMSSRNVRLSPEGRAASSIIYKALSTAKSESELQEILKSQPLLELDYATFIDEETFLPSGDKSKNVRAIVAGWINGVRLLDNMHMEISA